MSDAKPFTLLIHGLHMHGLYMRPLAKKLKQAGFDTHAPSYHSLTKPIDAHSFIIHRWLLDHHDKQRPINLVGHSLGGLVIRHFLTNYGKHWQIHRCVTLGTPHQGSVCADYAHRLLPYLVKQAYPNALDGHCAMPTHDVAIGAIAGNRSLGLGLPVLSYHSKQQHLDQHARQSDGTVYLSETYLPTLSDYLVLPVSHTGLLASPQAANEVIHFLKHGRFSRSSPPPT